MTKDSQIGPAYDPPAGCVRERAKVGDTVRVGTANGEVTELLDGGFLFVKFADEPAALRVHPHNYFKVLAPDEKRGLYQKWDVKRSDGTSAPGGKHADCPLFVLDLKHDPHALPALLAYIESCRRQFPQLAEDLTRMVQGHK